MNPVAVQLIEWLDALAYVWKLALCVGAALAIVFLAIDKRWR